MFPQFIGFVAAIRTLKQNWFATLAVKQWQINNGVLLFSSTKEETHESYCIVHHASNCYSTARKFMDNGSVVLLEKASTANIRLHIFTSAEREVKVSRRSGMYQSYNFLTRLGMQSL